MPTLHIDADILPYLAINKEYGHHVVRNKLRTFTDIAESLGLDHVNMHVGAKSKGGRENFPWYQANRKGPKDPERTASLESTRQYIADYNMGLITGTRWWDRETDDGLRASMKPGDILWSGDKDLKMVAGTHLELLPVIHTWETDATGFLKPPEKSKAKGGGNMFFWNQVMMGDSVDNIKPIKRGIGPATAYKLLCNLSEAEAFAACLKIAPFEELFPRMYCLWLRRNSNHLDLLDYLQEIGTPLKETLPIAQGILDSLPKPQLEEVVAKKLDTVEPFQYSSEPITGLIL